MESQKEQNSKKTNNGKSKGKQRFEKVYEDPRFAPVDGRTKALDKRFSNMLDVTFPMLQSGSRNIKDMKREKYLKSALSSVYNFKRSKKDEELDELKKAAKEVEEEDYESDDSVEATKKAYNLNDILGDGNEKEEEEIEHELEEKELTFDDILEKYKHKLEDLDEEELLQQMKEQQPVSEINLEDLTPEEQLELMKDDVWAKQYAEAPLIQEGEETKRIALMNFDWKLLSATDFFVLCSSFVPMTGAIEKVTVYLSDFGKQRLQQEKEFGPGAIFLSSEEYKRNQEIQKKIEDQKFENKKSRLLNKKGTEKKKKNYKRKTPIERDAYEEADDVSGLDPNKVRAYEFDRLKYYFAVVECDSVETATRLYESLDGYEIEATSIRLDLRFIPDDINFEGKEVLNECDELPEKYEPKKNLTAKQLQLTKPVLTWDVDDPQTEVLRQTDKFDAQTVSQLKQFLASDSEDSEEDDEEMVEEASDLGEDEDDDLEDDNLEEELFGDENDEEDIEEEVDDEEEEEVEEDVDIKPKSKLSLYKQLAKKALKKEKALNKSKEKDEIEVVFDSSKDFKQIGEQIVKKHAEKETNENESWWEKLERKRKEKKKEQKKLRKETLTNANNRNSDDDDEDDEHGNEESGEVQTFEDDIVDDDIAKEMVQYGISKESISAQKKKEAKQKQKQEKKKAELELMLSDYAVDGKGFNLKRDKQKERSRRKADREEEIKTNDNFELDLTDTRFKNALEDPDFNLEQTHPKFLKTKNTQKLLQERAKKREEKKNGVHTSNNKSETSVEDQIKRIKAKLKRKAPQNDATVSTKKKKIQ